MSVTISVHNSLELIEIEMLTRFTEEERTFLNLWNTPEGENSKEGDKSFEAYLEKVHPIISKYEIGITNANFRELWQLLGFNLSDSECTEIDLGEDLTGEISGGELEILKSKVQKLISYIEENPGEFSTPSVENQTEGVTIIQAAKSATSYIKKLKAILVLCQSTTKIRWY